MRINNKNVTANESSAKSSWNGGVLAMCASGTFGGGTLTLYWAANTSDAGVTIGSLAAAGAIEPTVGYNLGYIWYELAGATAPDINVFWGRNSHPSVEVLDPSDFSDPTPVPYNNNNAVTFPRVG